MRAGIIGLGQIAWMYDGGNQTADGGALTHLSAYRAFGFDAICGMDQKTDACTLFADETGISATDSFEEFVAFEPDVVSITSPNACHAEHLRKCLAAGVKTIWLEKPASMSSLETRELAKLAENCGARVLVGFQRRYLPSYKYLIENDLGQLSSVEIIYSRGLQTNGIHLIDFLLCMLEEEEPQVLVAKSGTKPVHTQEQSPSALLLTDGNIPISIIGMDLEYHAIDITAHYTNGRIAVRKGGIHVEIERKIPNPQYENYFRLGDSENMPSIDQLTTENSMVFKLMIEDLISGNKALPLSNLHTASRSQQLVEKIIEASL